MIRHSIAGQDAGIEFPGNAGEIWKESSFEFLVDEPTTVFRPENRVNEMVVKVCGMRFLRGCTGLL
jgi:hypothetical protein